MPEVGEAELLFDGRNFADRFLKTVFSELLVLNVLKFVAHFV